MPYFAYSGMRTLVENSDLHHAKYNSSVTLTLLNGLKLFEGNFLYVCAYYLLRSIWNSMSAVKVHNYVKKKKVIYQRSIKCYYITSISYFLISEWSLNAFFSLFNRYKKWKHRLKSRALNIIYWIKRLIHHSITW